MPDDTEVFNMSDEQQQSTKEEEDVDQEPITEGSSEFSDKEI